MNMSLDELSRVPSRHYRAIKEHYRDRWNRPEITEQYLMRVCQFLDGSQGEKPLSKYIIKFEEVSPQQNDAISLEERDRAARQRWSARVGLPTKKQT